MDKVFLGDKLQKLEQPWTLAEIKIAFTVLDDLNRFRQEATRQEVCCKKETLRLYESAWKKLEMLLHVQLERWQRGACQYRGGRSVENRYHMALWQERWRSEAEQHQDFLAYQLACQSSNINLNFIKPLISTASTIATARDKTILQAKRALSRRKHQEAQGISDS